VKLDPSTHKSMHSVLALKLGLTFTATAGHPASPSCHSWVPHGRPFLFCSPPCVPSPLLLLSPVARARHRPSSSNFLDPVKPGQSLRLAVFSLYRPASPRATGHNNRRSGLASAPTASSSVSQLPSTSTSFGQANALRSSAQLPRPSMTRRQPSMTACPRYY
jgi:hypothetical protein